MKPRKNGTKVPTAPGGAPNTGKVQCRAPVTSGAVHIAVAVRPGCAAAPTIAGGRPVFEQPLQGDGHRRYAARVRSRGCTDEGRRDRRASAPSQAGRGIRVRADRDRAGSGPPRGGRRPAPHRRSARGTGSAGRNRLDRAGRPASDEFVEARGRVWCGRSDCPRRRRRSAGNPVERSSHDGLGTGSVTAIGNAGAGVGVLGLSVGSEQPRRDRADRGLVDVHRNNDNCTLTDPTALAAAALSGDPGAEGVAFPQRSRSRHVFPRACQILKPLQPVVGRRLLKRFRRCENAS